LKEKFLGKIIRGEDILLVGASGYDVVDIGTPFNEGIFGIGTHIEIR